MSTVGRGHLEYRGECSVPQVIQNRLRRHKKKVSFQIVLYQRFQKRNREKQRWSSIFRNVTFFEKHNFIFLFPFPLFLASNLGKINANFSPEIVTSSAVLGMRDIMVLVGGYHRYRVGVNK